MKKAILIIIIFVATISFGFFEISKVKTILTTMEDCVLDMNREFELNQEDITIFYDKVGDIKEYWQEKELFLCYIFNHRDLGTITDSLNRLLAYVKNNDYDNATAELSMLREYSTQNYHIMGFNMHNIF